MKKTGIINPALLAACASVGHTEYLVIADPGLPLPKGVEVIDLTLVRGQPAFIDTLRAVAEEFVVESYIVAAELPQKSGPLYEETKALLAPLPEQQVPHERFKELVGQARAIIRTGETTSYANVILVGGVNF